MNPVLVGLVLAVQTSGGWQEAPPLPRPVTNNAVAGIQSGDVPAVFSFMGLDSEKGRDSEVSWAFRWNTGDTAWTEVRSVPGPGRLAATAEAVGGKIYLFGGYTVSSDGSERSVGNVDVYDPVADRWSAAAPTPVPVDDAVSGVWRDSLVYLVSGWHDTGNETLVQIYDPAADRWQQGTPIPGRPRFGHAGGIARDVIVYVDGVVVRSPRETPAGESRFRLEATAWRGDIDPESPGSITWRRLSDHPGSALYRAAGAPVGTRVVFFGGGSGAYNYNGIGYDGRSVEPVAAAFAYDILSDRWSRLPPPWVPTMDHRAAVRVGGFVVLAGGMESGQRVTDRVQRISVVDLVTGR